jgi:acyl carrier protein
VGSKWGARIMTVRTSRGNLRACALQADLSSNNIRAIIADQLDIDVERINDQSHIMRDLGADWLQRLYLVIFLEESAGIELDDDDVDQINVVGDLIRCIASAMDKRRPRAA